MAGFGLKQKIIVSERANPLLVSEYGKIYKIVEQLLYPTAHRVVFQTDMPSSLTMLLPPAVGFSPHPPVSVYGTGTHETIAAFLGTWLTRFATLIRSTSRLRIAWRICQPDSFSACTGISSPGSCSPHASPQFCSYVVQESKPVVHRIRLSTSP